MKKLEAIFHPHCLLSMNKKSKQKIKKKDPSPFHYSFLHTQAVK